MIWLQQMMPKRRFQAINQVKRNERREFFHLRGL
jgi:hypothetical protein